MLTNVVERNDGGIGFPAQAEFAERLRIAEATIAGQVDYGSNARLEEGDMESFLVD
jgi:hypothetical protein